MTQLPEQKSLIEETFRPEAGKMYVRRVFNMNDPARPLPSSETLFFIEVIRPKEGAHSLTTRDLLFVRGEQAQTDDAPPSVEVISTQHLDLNQETNRLTTREEPTDDWLDKAMGKMFATEDPEICEEWIEEILHPKGRTLEFLLLSEKQRLVNSYYRAQGLFLERKARKN